MAKTPKDPGSYGDVFSTALWELGLGFSTDAIAASLSELFPGTSQQQIDFAIQTANAAEWAGAGFNFPMPASQGGNWELPVVPGIAGGYYYDVEMTFLEEDGTTETTRQIRVTSDNPLSLQEIQGAAFDQAVYYQDITGSEKFQGLDLTSAEGAEAITASVTAAYQGIG